MTKLTQKLQNIAFTRNQLILITSAYIALLFNIPFYTKTWQAVTVNDDYNGWFVLSVPIVLFLLTLLFHSLITFKQLLKPVLIVSVCLSSLLFYATYHYGIIFDYGMIQNSLETDHAEAMSYFNVYALLFFLVFGLFPSCLIYLVKTAQRTVIKEAVTWGKMVVVASVVLSIVVGVFYVNYAAVGRNNRELTSYITPFKLYVSAYKYVTRTLTSSPREFHILDAKPFINKTGATPTVTVLVLGETARAQNFSLNGYDKPTNQYSSASDLVSFSSVSSCGTATAVSVPCMFSRLNRKNYDKNTANSQQNVLDLIQLAGADVTWIDNNNGGCKGVCSRVKTIEIDERSANPLCDGEYCLDEILLEYLDDQLSTQSNNNRLIVLHMMGSHGPTYYRRYPTEHRIFTPDCQRSDIQHCSQDELVNTYDNTIAYTDFVLAEIIERLQTLASDKQVSTNMIYVSDHGESLGENGVYLHGLPYAFSPKDQTHVPLLFWQSKQASLFDRQCLMNNRNDSLSHDNFFDIVLGIQSVMTSVYDKNQDALYPCKSISASTLESSSAHAE
ncbi:MAG: phosphoethanolamine--lipid A transferase [Glaciecola sp.]|jgi:lipid A ethanolaminephosphotransferase